MASELLITFYHSLIFTLPAFFANAVPVYMSGLGRIDGGRTFRDGKPLLGSHKTNGGLIGAIIGGGMAGLAIPLYFPEIFNEVENMVWWYGFVLGFGTIVGDSVGSFFKRRSNVKSGKPFPVMDQVGFIIFALLFVAVFVKFPLEWAWTIIPATMLIHLGANGIAYLMGWKDTPW